MVAGSGSGSGRNSRSGLSDAGGEYSGAPPAQSGGREWQSRPSGSAASRFSSLENVSGMSSLLLKLLQLAESPSLFHQSKSYIHDRKNIFLNLIWSRILLSLSATSNLASTCRSLAREDTISAWMDNTADATTLQHYIFTKTCPTTIYHLVNLSVLLRSWQEIEIWILPRFIILQLLLTTMRIPIFIHFHKILFSETFIVFVHQTVNFLVWSMILFDGKGLSLQLFNGNIVFVWIFIGH